MAAALLLRGLGVGEIAVGFGRGGTASGRVVGLYFVCLGGVAGRREAEGIGEYDGDVAN